MDNLLENLKVTRKKAIVKGTILSYIKSISELFITSPGLFNKVCSEFGLSSDELIQILNSENLSNLSLLDEIMVFSTKENTKNQAINEDNMRLSKEINT